MESISRPTLPVAPATATLKPDIYEEFLGFPASPRGRRALTGNRAARRGGERAAFRPAFQRGMRLVAVFLPERGIGPDPERPGGAAPAVSENMGRGRCQCAHLAAGGFYRVPRASL